MKSGDEWDPTVSDNTITDKMDWYNNLEHADDSLIQTHFDEYGNYTDKYLPTSLV